MKKATDINEVIRYGLCNRCGSCSGLSGGKIVFSDREGKCMPDIKMPLDEEENRVIWNACSGKGFNFPEHRKLIFGVQEANVYTGYTRKIYIGFATDEKIRSHSGSGGFITALLIWLLENNMIDGAVVTGMSDEKPWLTRTYIATTAEGIIRAAQSKYIITTVNEILPEIAAFDGRLAYVGLPGQVQSIRLLQQAKHPSVRNICYIFGPFYGNTLHFSSVKSFLRSFRVRDYHQIRKLYFRYGEWPGNMRVEMNDGRIFEMPKFHANYLIPFHILKNSLLCTDLTNEFTDISGGDAWAPVYEERGKGFSMIITRSDIGEQIVRRMETEGVLELQQISEVEALEMHSHGYDLKKRGTFIRMKYRSWLGLRNPDYGYKISGFSFSRYLMEFIIDAMFILAGTRLARFTVERIPPGFIGRVFEKARKFWKRSTYNIKRENL